MVSSRFEITRNMLVFLNLELVLFLFMKFCQDANGHISTIATLEDYTERKLSALLSRIFHPYVDKFCN